jgi:hypothetical protein
MFITMGRDSGRPVSVAVTTAQPERFRGAIMQNFSAGAAGGVDPGRSGAT